MALAILAVTVGLAALIFLDAFCMGMNANMILNVTNTFSGDGQIHAKGFRESFETENSIKNLNKILSKLSSDDLVKSFSLRTQNYCMLSSPYDIRPVVLFGIDPGSERDISQIDEAIIRGGFLRNDNLNQILIGKRLSQLLNIDIGDRIVVTMAQAQTGDLSQELFRVGGIFRFNVREMDTNIAFINLKKAQQLLVIGQNVHEIALKFHNMTDKKGLPLDYWERYSIDENEAVSWKELIPGIEATISIAEFATAIMGFLLFAVVAVVVMNTLFMSLYERMYEFGVLRAIGTRPSRMAAMILVEAGVLCLVGIILGLIIGVSISHVLSIVGIDYVGVEMGGITLTEPIRPVITLRQLTLFPISVFMFTILAAIWPAIHAARLTPAIAMKKRG